MKLIKNYYKSYYKEINKKLVISEYGNGVFMQIGKYISTDDEILDIGCGCGYLLRALEIRGFKRLSGVELDKYQYLEAKKILNKVKLFNSDACAFLKKSKKKFNVIIAYDFIEHLSKNKIIPFLRLARYRLCNGGILIIKTPNADSPLTASRMRYGDFTHEIIFNSESISMVLNEAKYSKTICCRTKTSNSITTIIKDLFKNIIDLFLRVYLFTYIGRKAFNRILTTNFIAISKK
jgi:2-polyprenyl-3-methyl-5-hydroxy-6-metoxy-1,4-benzoquinol methylase